MLATVEYEHEPDYAEYIKPARELCMRNLRDPILISAEQLGEALGFVTMAQALRIFGGEIQARRRRPLFVLPLTPTLTSLVLAHAPPGVPPGGANVPSCVRTLTFSTTRSAADADTDVESEGSRIVNATE